MGFFFVMLVSSVAGAIGWWVGNLFGIAFAITLSLFASALGLFYGQKWNREFFS